MSPEDMRRIGQFINHECHNTGQAKNEPFQHGRISEWFNVDFHRSVVSIQ
jgi:hypothetical protein